ncbi:taste receptor type 1 member 3-like [Hyla sarda]|uniref:taste receptor type 1 member 3-like n=1 Tax=Hyla sarda TaxID=327740 RepID=UPI0024C37916|nr:taste receptor type 1 member 3-like [Hyla sarda]
MSGFSLVTIVSVVNCLPALALTKKETSTNVTFFSLPGDFKLGGLFALHNEADASGNWKGNETMQCKHFNPNEFMALLAMKFAVDEINNSSTLLPNVSLGYDIYDTCYDVKVIQQASLRFLTEREESVIQVLCNYTDYKTEVVAVVGPSSSDMAMATGKMFSFFHLPQISYWASSELLSDKSTFLSFMRTVPSDQKLVQGMVQLLKEFQWNWISIIASRNGYGVQGLFQFTTSASQNGICIAYQAYIPENISDPNFNTSVQKILSDLQNTGVNVTIVFSTLPEAQAFLKVVIGTQQKMVWIASPTWSQALTIQQMPGLQSIGTVIGFSVESKTVLGFQDYVFNILNQIEQERHLLLNSSSANLGTSQYTQDLQEQCQSCSMLTTGNITMLQEPSILALAYHVYTAVYFIAQAIHNIMCTPMCNLQVSNILPWQLLQELKYGNITVDNIMLDSYGNPNIGYNILTWIYKKKSPFLTVGTFQEKMTLKRSQITWHSTKVPESTCSRQCSEGQVKVFKDFKTCCFKCVTCPEGTYVNSTECTSCPTGEWSKAGSKSCQHPTYLYLSWSNYYVITLLGFMGLIILLILVVTMIMFRHRHTPLYVASGGFHCYITLLGLLCMCVSIFFYIGKPTDWMCLLQQPLLSLSFTTFLGPILVKSMQILFCTLSGKSRLYWLTHTGSWIILLLTFLGQVLLCTMYVKSSQLLSVQVASYDVNSLSIYVSCKYEPLLQFGLMFAYNGLLVLWAFQCSFLAEKPVHQYYMGRDITVAMLSLILAWIIFIPTYVSTDIASKSLIQMTFILGSCLGVLSAVFFPKCYLLIYKKELNSSEYFGTHIPDHRDETATE